MPRPKEYYVPILQGRESEAQRIYLSPTYCVSKVNLQGGPKVNWGGGCPALTVILGELQEYLVLGSPRKQKGGQLKGLAPSPTFTTSPVLALRSPPPAWSGSQKSPPHRALRHVPPALQRGTPRRSALPEAAGSAGGHRAPPVARPPGTWPPRRLPPTRTETRTPAGSACGQP